MKFDEHLTQQEISKKLLVSINKVKWVTSKKYEDVLLRKKEKEQKEQNFIERVKKYLPISNSLNHLCKQLKVKSCDGYYKKIQKIIEEHKLSTEHFGTIAFNRNNSFKMSDKEFFVDGEKREGKSVIKRLVEGKHKKYECEECGIFEWNGKPLTLQIHHINGKHDDNRIGNLQILCPNCHTQTDTFGKRKNKQCKHPKRHTTRKNCIVCGKEIEGWGKEYCSHECSYTGHRKTNITADELLTLIKTMKSYTKVGNYLSVSGNTIKKYTKTLGIFDVCRQYIISR